MTHPIPVIAPDQLPPIRFKTGVFLGLYQEESCKRRVAIEHAIQIIRSWALSCLHYYSERRIETFDNDSTEDRINGDVDNATMHETLELLHAHVLMLLRMSRNCPFSDVRIRFREILKELKVSVA